MGTHTTKIYQDEALSPMIITGGAISEGTEGTATIGELTALLREGTGATDRLVYVTLAEQANQALTAADTKYYVILDYNSGSPQLLIQADAANGTTEIGLGVVMKEGAGGADPDALHFANCCQYLQNGVARLHKRAYELRFVELASGCTISDEGSASRQFNIAEGIVYHGINKLTPFSDGAFDSGTTGFTYVYRDGADSWNYSTGATVISNTQYYDGAYALATVDVTRYACHWVYLHPGEEHVYVVYGTTNDKLAVAETEPAPADLPDVISEFGILLGCIIIQRDATAFAKIQMVTDVFFSGTSVADHGSLGGLDDDDHTQYILHSLADAANDFLVASADNTFAKQTLAQTLTTLGKAVASGLASLNASTKVVEQPASITDHLDDTAGGTDALTTKAPTSNVVYDHAILDATAGARGHATAAQITKLDGIEVTADITDAVNVGTSIHGVADKNPPIDADKVPLIDTAAANVLKTSTWTNIKAFLKTYFDTLYNLYVHPNHSGEVTSVADGAQTIINDAVTYAKMQNVSATDKVLGRVTVGAGDVEEIACTAAGRSMIAAANAAAQLVLVTPLTTRGDIMVRDATVSTRLAKGTEGHVLTMGADEPTWAAATGGATTFVELTDTPADFTDDELKVVRVNATPDALEFVPFAATYLDNTAGGTDAEVAKGATSNVVYDHTANTATPHGAVSAATASKIIVRDASARAKVAAPSAEDDIALKSNVTTVNTALTNHGNLTTAHSAVSTATASRMVVRDAQGQAAFAAPAAAGDALIKGTRHLIAEMPTLTTDKAWKGVGGVPAEADWPSGGVAFTERAGGENHQVTDASTWEDYDLSGIIGAGAVSALISIYNNQPSAATLGARKNGTALVRSFTVGAWSHVALLTEVDANRIIDIYDSSTNKYGDFSVLGYWS